MRKFDLIKKYKEETDLIPTRATKVSAGYDFKACEDVVIPSIWKQLSKGVSVGLHGIKFDKEVVAKPTLVGTGIKAYMEEDEVLEMYNRSSNPIKNGLIVSNGVGVIDGDYVDNPSNEGHIMVQFINYSLSDKIIKKGDRVAQGVFKKFLKVENDNAEGVRTGGHGSTGAK